MKAFDEKAVRKEFLWSGYEDWTGLWEAVWWVQTEYPELRGAPARDKAREVLRALLSEGLVYICFLDEDTNTESPIVKDEAHRILDEDSSWEPPTSPKHQLRYLTTEKGAKPFSSHAEASS